MYKDILEYRLTHSDLIETIDQMYGGFLLSTIEGRVFYANQAVEDISGIPLKDIIGKTPKEMEKAGIIINQSTKVKSKAPITMIQKLKNGKEILITSKPIYDETGSIVCFAANYHQLQQLNYLNTLHDHNRKPEHGDSVPSTRIQTDNWIGESYDTYQLKEKVAKIAASEAIVLIQGASGVGKEVVAKNIHKLSQRSTKPYIQINCGAIPEDLIEAELFGYEKGAFTGAISSKEGLFEAANGGTVLLDEIGEMPLHLQVRLLRVIQTKKITRVGGTKERVLNVRFIAATNKDLLESVKQKEFREDLYYRLNVIPIFIPPLKNRKDDILPLCEYFLDKFNEKYKTNKVLTPEALQLFQEFHWPGNVRQLENIIERLVIITEDDTISPIYLPDEYKQRHAHVIEGIKPLKEAREQAESRMIKLAINKYGSIRKAAKYLEVDHSTIVRKMKKFHIKEDAQREESGS
jgi:transcriptional regulator with PAS, ATPase and Fis domain